MAKSNHPKKPAPQDWHRADIKAALEKAGWSLRKLSKAHGYAAPTTLTIPLARPWPKGERIIADAIGIDPAKIWPSRYRNKYSAQAVGKSECALVEEGLCA
ncbi:helix-turn-helix domain-containing protein [Eoetvoesiella caeni]